MRVAGMALALAAFVLASPASAAETFVVDTTSDGVDADGGDGVCATPAGDCTLRAAIGQSNDTPGSDIVRLPTGTFKLTRAPDLGTPSNDEGSLEPTDPVDIVGRGAGRTVIKQTRTDRVLNSIVDNLAGASLSRLTVTGGRVTAPGNQCGGGIANEGVLSLDLVTVRSNDLIPGQTAGNSFGGGICQRAGILIISRSKIKDNLVQVKSATGTAAGGGVMTLAGLLAIQESKVAGNVARQIGGTAGTSTGGGVDVRGSTVITNTTISRNRADEGGGLNASTGNDPGQLMLDSSTINGNLAKMGGGLGLRSAGDHTLINSTISANIGPKAGSGIYATAGTADLTHVTIADNSAGQGHAVVETDATMDPEALRLYGSIVTGRGSDCGAPAGVLDVNEQNVFGDVTCSPGISTDLRANPELRPLARNGGPTRTHALKASSPAIDFVSTGTSAPVDQRGVPRPPQESDAGSFERG